MDWRPLIYTYIYIRVYPFGSIHPFARIHPLAPHTCAHIHSGAQYPQWIHTLKYIGYIRSAVGNSAPIQSSIHIHPRALGYIR